MAILDKSEDPLGAAASIYWETKEEKYIDVHSDLCEMDQIPASYLFRKWVDMPELEQKALKKAQGKVLDIGAGVGSHSLFLQQKGFDVTALEISPCSAEIMKKRGLQQVQLGDFMEIEVQKYDTLLLLMNGIGICGTLDQLPAFLGRCKDFLKEGGQILLDSSDLSYMYEGEDEEFIPEHYLGEVKYTMGFDEVTGPAFDWLFLDFDNLKEVAEMLDLNCEIIMEGSHFDYLARIY